jgi:hypothetical protein
VKQNLKGFIQGLSNEDYHSHPAIGSSTLARARRSWAHARIPIERTDALDLGSALHALVGEPQTFKDRFARLPEGMRRDARMKAYQEFLAANEGKTILTSDQWEQMDGMLGALLNHKLALGLLTGGQDEVSGFWTDAETGVGCKCRPDKLRDNDVIVDLKTAADASLEAFQKSLLPYGRHIQTAFYLDGCSTITGRPFSNFVHLVIENKYPFAVAVYALDDDSIEQGRREYRKLLKDYAFCLKLEHYPSYPEEVQTASLPLWAVKYE